MTPLTFFYIFRILVNGAPELRFHCILLYTFGYSVLLLLSYSIQGGIFPACDFGGREEGRREGVSSRPWTNPGVA